MNVKQSLRRSRFGNEWTRKRSTGSWKPLKLRHKLRDKTFSTLIQLENAWTWMNSLRNWNFNSHGIIHSRDPISSQLCNYWRPHLSRRNRKHLVYFFFHGYMIVYEWQHGVYLRKRKKRVESSMIIRHNSPLLLLVFQRSLKKTLTTWKYAVCEVEERKKRLKVENHILMPSGCGLNARLSHSESFKPPTHVLS